MSNSSIWLIDSPLSGTTFPGQSGQDTNDSEWVLHITQSSSITGASTSDHFVAYAGHPLRGSSLTSLQECSLCILEPQATGMHSLIWFSLAL